MGPPLWQPQTPRSWRCYHDLETMRKQRVWLPLVAARIFAVSGAGFAAAVGIFLLVAALWLPGLIALAVAPLFIGLMFLVERKAERSQEP